MTSLEPATYTSVADWAEWLISLDPVTAIRVGSTLTDGTTTRRLAAIIDEIVYAQTLPGGGTMTHAELANAVGVTRAAIARRAGRYRAAQRNPTTWTAILAPVGVDAPDGRCIDPDCAVTIADTGAPLFDHVSDLRSYAAIGRVTRVSITDGYLTAGGTMFTGLSVPTGRPTFDLYPSESPWSDDMTRMVFTAGRIMSIRVGFTTAWDDPRIGFSS